jgi:thiol-disulfide isomerase/thioredoxin
VSTSGQVTVPPEAARRGRGAGRALAALAVLTLAVNLSWIVRHLDWLRPLEAGQPAPPFDLAGLGPDGKPDGTRVRSDALEGRVVVLEFWATWCGPCLKSLPQLDRAARGWGDRVVTIAVNLDNPVKAGEIFKAAGWRLTLAASDEETATRYSVESLPHAVVIGADGVVRLVARGGGAVRDVEQAVARLLASP